MPRSTTRPPSSTRISSTRSRPVEPVGDEQRRTALGRARAGRRSGRRRPRASRCSAGSSRTRTGKSASSARATADPLALAAREARPRGARPRWRGPSGSPASQAPSPTRPRTSASSSSVAERRPIRRFSARVVSKRWASWLDQARRRVRTSSPASRSSGTPSRCTDPASTGRKRTRTAASVDLPAPLGPTTATRRPGARSRSTPRSAGRAGAGVGGPDARSVSAWGPSGSGSGTSGSTTGR